MLVLRYVCVVLLCLGTLAGCHSPYPGRSTAVACCPRSIHERATCWMGHDAQFQQPAGPSAAYFGYKPTCWGVWPTSAEEWRDNHCAAAGECDETWVLEQPYLDSSQPEPVPVPMPIRSTLEPLPPRSKPEPMPLRLEPEPERKPEPKPEPLPTRIGETMRWVRTANGHYCAVPTEQDALVHQQPSRDTSASRVASKPMTTRPRSESRPLVVDPRPVVADRRQASDRPTRSRPLSLDPPATGELSGEVNDPSPIILRMSHTITTPQNELPDSVPARSVAGPNEATPYLPVEPHRLFEPSDDREPPLHVADRFVWGAQTRCTEPAPTLGSVTQAKRDQGANSAWQVYDAKPTERGAAADVGPISTLVFKEGGDQ